MWQNRIHVQLSCNLCFYCHTWKCTFWSVGEETRIRRKITEITEKGEGGPYSPFLANNSTENCASVDSHLRRNFKCFSLKRETGETHFNLLHFYVLHLLLFTREISQKMTILKSLPACWHSRCSLHQSLWSPCKQKHLNVQHLVNKRLFIVRNCASETL